VAKGYSQHPVTDYSETFAPVVRMNNLRSLLAFAVQNKLIIHQMDVSCNYSVFTWLFGRRHLYGTTTWLYKKGTGEFGLSVTKISVWFEASTEVLEHYILRIQNQTSAEQNQVTEV